MERLNKEQGENHEKLKTTVEEENNEIKSRQSNTEKEIESVKNTIVTQEQTIQQQGQKIQQQEQKIHQQEEKCHKLDTSHAIDMENVTTSLLNLETGLKEAEESNTKELEELRKELNKPKTDVEENAKRIENLEKQTSETRKGPVFLIHGSYSFSFEDGQKKCSEHGTSMASEADIVEAQRIGLDVCSCGWVSNGKAIYPIQWARSGCGNKPGVMSCAWQNKWNVWCKTKIF